MCQAEYDEAGLTRFMSLPMHMRISALSCETKTNDSCGDTTYHFPSRLLQPPALTPPKKRLTARRILFPVVALAACCLTGAVAPMVEAFSMTMVSSSIPSSGRGFPSAPQVPPPFLGGVVAGPGAGVTSTLISHLAEAALKRRLRDQSGVKCDLTAKSSDLVLQGKVGPVTVRGRGWQSPLGLTCRAIDATVQTCHLDVGSIIAKRKLLLTTPANGDALIALNGEDFANFIMHPLIKPPFLSLSHGQGTASIQFLKDNVAIDPTHGTVTFYGLCIGRKWRFTLQRGKSKAKGAIVTATPVEGESTPFDADLEAASKELASVITDFFNEIVFELDGTFLTFKDLMVTDKGGAATVMIALKIVVKKFPSVGVAF